METNTVTEDKPSKPVATDPLTKFHELIAGSTPEGGKPSIFSELLAAAQTHDPNFTVMNKKDKPAAYLYRLCSIISDVTEAVYSKGLSAEAVKWYKDAVKTFQANQIPTEPEGFVTPTEKPKRERKAKADKAEAGPAAEAAEAGDATDATGATSKGPRKRRARTDAPEGKPKRERSKREVKVKVEGGARRGSGARVVTDRFTLRRVRAEVVRNTNITVDELVAMANAAGVTFKRSSLTMVLASTLMTINAAKQQGKWIDQPAQQAA